MRYERPRTPARAFAQLCEKTAREADDPLEILIRTRLVVAVLLLTSTLVFIPKANAQKGRDLEVSSAGAVDIKVDEGEFQFRNVRVSIPSEPDSCRRRSVRDKGRYFSTALSR